jgi:hypothetical protein
MSFLTILHPQFYSALPSSVGKRVARLRSRDVISHRKFSGHGQMLEACSHGPKRVKRPLAYNSTGHAGKKVCLWVIRVLLPDRAGIESCEFAKKTCFSGACLRTFFFFL